MANDWKAQIGSKLTICHGKVCIKGTRVIIFAILDCLAEGITEEEILVEYPSLQKEDISMALSYVDILARGESITLREK
ncbi:MAG: DUF433 domain-containing protein [Candidatus Heimdallarchaeota archaeon]